MTSAVYTTLTTPSVVDFACYGRFSSPFFDEIVIARGSLLQLYRVEDFRQNREYDDVSYQAAEVENGAKKARLVLLNEQNVAGTISSLLAVVREQRDSSSSSSNSTSRLSSLLVSFEHAKVARLNYSTHRLGWITVGLHTFEQDLTTSFTSPSRTAQKRALRADPALRCALLLVPDDHFAVLSLISDSEDLTGDVDSVDEHDEEQNGHYILPPSRLVPFKDFANDAATASSFRNVIDATFVAGFNKPTLAVLYQPLQSWQGLRAQEAMVAGVAASRPSVTNTGECRISLITMDLATRTQSTLWTLQGLPLNTFALFPAPAKCRINGLLALSPDDLIYVDSIQRSVYLGVNGYSSAQPAAREPLQLEDAHIVWSHAPFLFLRNGKIYRIHFSLDGSSVVGLHLDLAGHCTVASCVQSVGKDDTWIFVGSRLGPSVLLEMSRQYVSGTRPVPGGEAKGIEDTLDEDIYGTSAEDSAQTNRGTYKIAFAVADILETYGTIRDLVITDREGTDSKQLVACCGVDDEGSLVTLFPSVDLRDRKKLVESTAVIHRIWKVVLNDKICIISTDGITTQIAWSDCSDELNVDTDFASFLIEPILQDAFYCQVTERAVLIFRSKDGELVLVHEFEQENTVEIGEPTTAQIVGNKLIVHFDTSMISIFELCLEDGIPLVRTVLMPEAFENGDIVDVHAFSALVPMMQISQVSRPPEAPARTKGAQLGFQPTGKRRKLNNTDVADNDDDDTRLYSRQAPYTNSRPQDSLLPKAFTVSSGIRDCLGVIRRNGSLQIFDLHNLESVFASGELADLSSTLSDGGSAKTHQDQEITLRQIRFANLGHGVKSLCLVSRYSDGEIVLYMASPGRSESSAAHHVGQARLDMKFVKSFSFNSNEDSQLALLQLQNSAVVVILGEQPNVIYKNDHGAIRHYPWATSITAIASNCTNDFAIVSAEKSRHAEVADDDSPQVIYQGHWHDDWCFDNPLPSTTHILGKTPVKIQYNDAVDLCYVATAAVTPMEVFDNEGNSLYVEVNARRFPATCYTSSLQVISGDCRESADQFNLDENELVTAMEYGNLNTHMKAGVRPYLVVGTSITRGEDYPSRGAIYIFDTIKGQGGKYAIKLMCKELLTQAVTSLSLCDGLVAAAVNQKIFTKAFHNYDQIVSNAFIELGVYTTGLYALRNMLVAADIRNGINLIAFQEEPFKLIQVTHESRPLSITNFGFLVDGINVSFLLMDTTGNLRLAHLEPYDPSSMGGQRFIDRGDFYIGRRAVATRLVFRLDDRTSQPQTRLVVANEDGSIACIIPVSTTAARALQNVVSSMDSISQPSAGLSAKTFRLVGDDSVVRPSAGPTTDQIVDGDSLCHFGMMSLSSRAEVARRARSQSTSISALIRSCNVIL